MGKSGKKIKSDRINTLRKQYDAFLEDDKKRKDRNEYILGRLEEMRSSALVKIRHKDNSHVNDHYYANRRLPNYLSNFSRIEDDQIIFRNQANIPVHCIAQQLNPSVLSEISKNYILIPKLQSTISNSVKNLNSVTENVDTDWKSKYNILNELKKSEKESIPENVKAIFEEENKSSFLTQESLNKQENKITNDNTLNKPKNNWQEFNPPINNIQANKLNTNTIKEDLLKSSPDFKPYNSVGVTGEMEISNNLIPHNTECNENDQHSTFIDNIHEMEASKQQFTEHKPDINTKIEVLNNVPIYNTSHEIKNTDTNEVENQLNKKNHHEKFENELLMQKNYPKEFFEQDVNEKNFENVKRTDYRELNSNNVIHITEGSQQCFKDNLETESELNINVQNYETKEAPIINDERSNAEINELENEQAEIFYTENSESKYDYDENNENTLDYPTEKQNYINEQYSYHDEIQQEQPYTSEINEHEETTERYDPNYEQQYTDNYENVMNVPQYENQQYVVDNSYEIQQEPLAENVNYEEVQQDPLAENVNYEEIQQDPLAENVNYEEIQQDPLAENVNYEEVQQDPLAENVNYKEIQPNSENFEVMQSENTKKPHQNQEENVYNYENENYESQHYITNEQEQYSTTDPTNVQGQYAVEQEYVETHAEQEIVKDIEKRLDLEDGYVDNQNTILIDNTEKPLAPDVSPNKNEPSLEVS